MQDLMFLWLADVYGYSKDPRHLGEFDVESYSNNPNWNISRPELGSASVKRAFDVFLKYNTPDFQNIFELHRTRQTIRTAVISIEKNIGGRSFRLKSRFRMDNVIISFMLLSYDSPNIGGITLGYENIDVTSY